MSASAGPTDGGERRAGPVASATEVRRYHALLLALVATLAVHLLAVGAMVTLLAPGVDMHATVAERAASIAAHPTRWRLGWLMWQLTAASDVAVSATLLLYLARTPGRPGVRWALAGGVATLVAIVPDQLGEALIDTRVVEAARLAVADATALPAFLTLERRVLLLTGTCGGTGYTLMGVAWVLAIVRAGGRTREQLPLLGLGAVSMALFGAAAWVNERAIAGATLGGGYPGFDANYALNAAGFSLFLVFVALAIVSVGRGHHARHPAADAGLHRLVWPVRGPRERVAGAATEPALLDLRRLFSGVSPMPVLRSEITDVVYLNWLVPAERVASLLPAPLELDSLGGRAVVSILTYQHGHFGPAQLGPARALLPSPRQSNWRLYVRPEREGAARDAIYFLKTCLDAEPHVLGSRLMSDGLPSHLALRIEHRREGQRLTTAIDPGEGSAPDLRSTVETGGPPVLPAAFAAAFPSWEAAVRYLVDQNRALSVHPALGAVIESRIAIPIDLASVAPAKVVGAVESRWLSRIVEGAEPFAFVVPAVAFEALGERRTVVLEPASRARGRGSIAPPRGARHPGSLARAADPAVDLALEERGELLPEDEEEEDRQRDAGRGEPPPPDGLDPGPEAEDEAADEPGHEAAQEDREQPGRDGVAGGHGSSCVREGCQPGSPRSGVHPGDTAAGSPGGFVDTRHPS